MKMSEPKRLHPIAALLNTLKQLKELLFPIVLFVVFGSKGNGSIFYLLASAGGLLIVFISGILSWYRFTYRVEDGELRIEYGLFVRKKRYIPFERIQSLDISEGIFHRPFKLVKMKVETAGGASGEAEAVLTAIRKEEANEIHERLVSIKKSIQLTDDHIVSNKAESEKVIYKISPKQLLLLASTSGGVGVVISAVIAFIFQFEELIPYETIFKEMENIVSYGAIFISLIVFIGFFLAWLASVIWTMLRYASFTLKKVDEDLIITRGWLEKKQFTIPLGRIQAIRFSENLIRQPLGLASVYVESAGGSAANEESAKVLILPIIKKEELLSTLTPYLESYSFHMDFTPAPSRAYRRYLIKGWLFIVPIILLAIISIESWGYLSIFLLPASALWSWIVYKDAAWGLNEGVLSLRFRTIVKNTVVMRKEKVQSLNIKKSHFQAKKHLATIEATVKSGHGGAGGKVVDLDHQDIETIYRWYSHE